MISEYMTGASERICDAKMHFILFFSFELNVMLKSSNTKKKQ